MSLFALHRGSGEAIYLQVARLLREEVLSSRKAGECLPSEHELAERFGVNRHTVRRAVEELIAAGLLARRHGRGTFVLEAPADYVLGPGTRFTATFESLGMTARSRIIRKLVIPARGGVAARLQLAENDPVIWIESLRLADERPVCVVSHFLPQARLPELHGDYLGGSLHEHLLERYGLALRRIESVVTATLPQGDDATLLGMAPHQPVLRVKSVNVDEATCAPVEYALTRFRADRIQLRINP